MLASQASQQITKILNQLASVPVVKPRVSPDSRPEEHIELGLSPKLGGSSMSVSSMGSDKNYTVEALKPDESKADEPEEDIEMSAVDLYNKNSRDRVSILLGVRHL